MKRSPTHTSVASLAKPVDDELEGFSDASIQEALKEGGLVERRSRSGAFDLTTPSPDVIIGDYIQTPLPDPMPDSEIQKPSGRVSRVEELKREEGLFSTKDRIKINPKLLRVDANNNPITR